MGSATITATTTNGLNAVCQITGSINMIKDFVAASQNTKSIQLTWTKQNGVDGYEIYKYNNSSKKYVKIRTNKGEDSKSYNSKSLSQATNYKYKVRSFATVDGKKVYGDYSNILNTATATAAPKLGTASAKTVAKLTWKKVAGANGYEVYMANTKHGEYTLVRTLNSAKKTSYSQKGLTSKQTYFFKMRAYKTVNGVNVYSRYSKIKSVKAK